MTSSEAHGNVSLHSFTRSDALRALVDAALSDTGELPNGLIRYEEAYKMVRETLSQEENVLLHEAVLRNSPSDIFYDLGLVAQEITWSSILASAPLEPYFSIAHTLRDALRHSDNVPALSSEHPGWIKAVRVVASYECSRSKELSPISRPLHKDVTFASAVQYFINLGVNLKLVGDTLPLSPDEKHRLAAAAYRPLMTMGDVRAMKAVEGLLSTKFDGTVKRLHLHPNPDMVGKKMDRSIPYGYLYRIALKTLGKERTNLSTREMAEKAVVSCTNLGAVFNVEPFSQYETMFAPRPGRVLEVLREIIIYDELFTIPQCEPRLANQVIRNLFDGIDIEGQSGWSAEDALVLFDVLLALTMDFVRSRFVKRSELFQRLSTRVGVCKAEKLVQSFALGPVNAGYELPADALHAETRECMLVRASKSHFWVPGQLFLVPAFYNRMVSL